jgi:hypothetical protein
VSSVSTFRGECLVSRVRGGRARVPGAPLQPRPLDQHQRVEVWHPRVHRAVLGLSDFPTSRGVLHAGGPPVERFRRPLLPAEAVRLHVYPQDPPHHQRPDEHDPGAAQPHSGVQQPDHGGVPDAAVPPQAPPTLRPLPVDHAPHQHAQDRDQPEDRRDRRRLHHHLLLGVAALRPQPQLPHQLHQRDRGQPARDLLSQAAQHRQGDGLRGRRPPGSPLHGLDLPQDLRPRGDGGHDLDQPQGEVRGVERRFVPAVRLLVPAVRRTVPEAAPEEEGSGEEEDRVPAERLHHQHRGGRGERLQRAQEPHHRTEARYKTILLVDFYLS